MRNVPLVERGGRPYPEPHRGRVNLSSTERLLTVLGGTALLAWGVRRRGPTGIAVAVLGAGLAARGATGHCPGYAALGVNRAHGPVGPVLIERSVTINRPAVEVYGFWRNLENLPRFMRHLEAVRDLGGGRSHWVARLAGQTLEWDAEIVTDQTHLIGWESLDGASIENAGSVRFETAPGGRGTEVKLTLAYRPPGGIVGKAAGELLSRVTAKTIKEDLRDLKRILEAGEIPTISGQPSGRAA